MKPIKEQTVYARIDGGMHARLIKAADAAYCPVSQIIRDAIRRELDRLESANGKQRKSK